MGAGAPSDSQAADRRRGGGTGLCLSEEREKIWEEAKKISAGRCSLSSLLIRYLVC